MQPAFVRARLDHGGEALMRRNVAQKIQTDGAPATPTPIN
jgi:hypothetical protein